MAIGSVENPITTRDKMTREIFLGPAYLLTSPALFNRTLRSEWLHEMEVDAKCGMGPTLVERLLMNFVPKTERVDARQRIAIGLHTARAARRKL